MRPFAPYLSIIWYFVPVLLCLLSKRKSLRERVLPFSAFCDSLQQRGFVVDSAKTDSAFTRVVMANPTANYRLMLAQKGGVLQALQENYKVSTNDSTRQLWQQMHDQFEKEIGAWPNMLKNGDDHRVAKFEADGGFITLTLENTYTPTLQVLYEVKQK